MQNNNSYLLKFLKVLILIFIVSIPFSRALLSISGILIAAVSLAFAITNKKKISLANHYYILLLVFVALCTIDFARVYEFSNWTREISIKLPLILLPLPFLLAKQIFDRNFVKYILITFVFTISISSSISVVNYFLNYEELNKLVLQSKNIPVAGGMHHITFSVYCALSVFLAVIAAFDYKIKWLHFFAIINLINLHILSARTGLAGFYITAFFLIFVITLKNRKYLKFALPSLIIILILPVTTFFTIKSFKNRVLNTVDDLKTTLNQKDANYKSMAMRVEATKTAWSIFEKNILFGVGTGNLRKHMDIEYELKNTNLFLENRILPHNQFVYEAATHGISGLLVLLLFIFLPVFWGFNKLSFSFVSLWMLLLFGMFFECFFERQHGVVLVSFFWFLFLAYKENLIQKLE
ncbi:MAG: O-antigen ligase family protein [Bacteroidetes bacterium]|nr:O-antigen ligase family protein [Bacteroidota bacterium]